MTTGLEIWLNQATRCLSKESFARVRIEIGEHYESAREAAVHNGASVEEADRFALPALGHAEDANFQYRRVLLTSAEARMLHEGNWEAHAICSHAWVKWMISAVPVAALSAAAGLFLTGANGVGRVLLVAGLAMAFLVAAPFLPIYTVARGRIFRLLKWVVLTSTLVLAFGPNALKWSWLLASCLWPLMWTESTRISIRRKLPAAQWPKQLYF